MVCHYTSICLREQVCLHANFKPLCLFGCFSFFLSHLPSSPVCFIVICQPCNPDYVPKTNNSSTFYYVELLLTIRIAVLQLFIRSEAEINFTNLLGNKHES